MSILTSWNTKAVPAPKVHYPYSLTFHVAWKGRTIGTDAGPGSSSLFLMQRVPGLRLKWICTTKENILLKKETGEYDAR